MSDVVGVDQYAVQVKAEYILATPPNTTAEAAAAEVVEKSHDNGDNNRDTNSHRDSNTNNNSKKKKNRDRIKNVHETHTLHTVIKCVNPSYVAWHVHSY